MKLQAAEQPTITVEDYVNGEVKYQAVIFKFKNGKEIAIHAHTHIFMQHGHLDLPEQLWISTNGPLTTRTHSQNSVSVGIDYVYPPQP